MACSAHTESALLATRIAPLRTLRPTLAAAPGLSGKRSGLRRLSKDGEMSQPLLLGSRALVHVFVYGIDDVRLYKALEVS